MPVTSWTFRNFLKPGKGASQLFRNSSCYLTVVLVTLCWIYLDSCLAPFLFQNARAEAKANKTDLSSFKLETKAPNGANLHRLDFLIKGTSCAVCLIAIENKLKAAPGVLKLAVMLKYPYGTSIIYDAKQISRESILHIPPNHNKSVTLSDIHDTHLKQVPEALIPPITERQMRL